MDELRKQTGHLFQQTFAEHAYIEQSPSGQGLRIFCLGKATRTGKGTQHKWIECYDASSPRYLTVTGERCATSATELRQPMQKQIDAMHHRFFLPQEQPRETFAVPILNSDTLLEKSFASKNG
ncbi:MAG: hypothetical protein AAGJ35_15925, partial [Myxococcota bacterium]